MPPSNPPISWGSYVFHKCRYVVIILVTYLFIVETNASCRTINSLTVELLNCQNIRTVSIRNLNPFYIDSNFFTSTLGRALLIGFTSVGFSKWAIVVLNWILQFWSLVFSFWMSNCVFESSVDLCLFFIRVDISC